MLFTQMEGFFDGHLFKFVSASPYAADAKRQLSVIETIWASAEIYNPPTTTSPDAPGVTVVATRLSLGGGRAQPPPTGQKYVFTEITVENDGTSPYMTSAADFSLVDGGDGVYHVGMGNENPNINTSGMAPTVIAPGEHIIGNVEFAIPISQTRVGLYWQPRANSPRIYVPTSH